VFEPYKTSELLVILAKMCDNKVVTDMVLESNGCGVVTPLLPTQGQRVTEEATAACAEMINTVRVMCVSICVWSVSVYGSVLRENVCVRVCRHVYVKVCLSTQIKIEKGLLSSSLSLSLSSLP
jgi:hypothetical protein